MSPAECQARNYIWMIGGKRSCCHDLPAVPSSHDYGNGVFNCIAVRSSSAVNSMPTPAGLAGSRATLLLLLGVKECLLDFMANADQPFFRMSSTVPKIVCLCLKF